VSDHQAAYPTTTMCERLGVSSSGYYAWIKRRPSQRAETDTMLIAEIHVAHEASRGTYGAPRIHAELAAKGLRVGRRRIARLMARARLAGVSRRRFVTTTVRNGGRQAPDLVERNFTAEAPDRLWVADITYIPTGAGFLYLAVVLDAYSRRIVGRSMATTLAKHLVLNALNMALTTTPCARVSSPPSSASCSIGAASRRRLRRDMRSSNSSKASAIDDDAIPRSDISRRSIMSGGIQRPRSIPTHTSLPYCSLPSRTSPSGGPKKGPSLTAAVRDGRTIVQAGTEEWLRPKPNQRMSRNRRPKCRQIR